MKLGCGVCKKYRIANSFIAKTWALRDGLMLCLQMNLQAVVVELDTRALVDALNNPAYVNTMISPLFDDCRQLINCIPRCCVRHIYYEANMCANKLAGLGLLQSLEFVLYPSPPVDLSPLVETDKCGLYSNRVCLESCSAL